MDLEEAKKILEVTEEEKKAIQNYQGYDHATINILGNFEAKAYYELSKIGWRMIADKETFKEKIDEFVNIYSAIYKSSRGTNYYEKLNRFTGNSEMQRMSGTTDQFLSTTTHPEEKAEEIVVSKEAFVIIRLGEGVPCMRVQSSEDRFDEQEVLVAPFCKITKNELVSNWNGRKYYNLSLEKPELSELSQEELEELEESVVNGFEDNLDNMKAYHDNKDRVEICEEFYQRAKGDREEQKNILKDKSEARKKMDEAYELTYRYKNDLRRLLEGLCRQKEIEIDKAEAIIEDDTQKRLAEMEEQRKIKEAEETKKQLEEAKQKFESQSTTAIGGTTRLTGRLDDFYNKLDNQDKSFKKIAGKLKIPHNGIYNINEIQQTIEEIKDTISEVNSEIGRVAQTMEDDNVTNLETLNTDISDITKYNDEINKGNEISNKFDGLLSNYLLDANIQMKEETYKRAMQLIRHARIAQYTNQKQALEKQSVGFFGKIFGKEKLRQAQLRNLQLRIEGEMIEIAPTEEQTNNFSVRNTLAELHIAMSEVGDQYSQYMKEYYEDIKEVYGQGNQQFSDQEIYTIAQAKLARNQNRLPAIIDKKENTRSQIARIEEENQNLELVNNQNRYSMRNNFANGYSYRDRGNVQGEILQKLREIAKGVRSNSYYRNLHSQTQDPKFHTADLWGQEW